MKTCTDHHPLLLLVAISVCCELILTSQAQTFTLLHTFGQCSGAGTGVNPQAPLLLSGSTLYGTTYRGGGAGFGTLFALNTNGAGTDCTGFVVVTKFNVDTGGFNEGGGHDPVGGVVISGRTLYGTTVSYGGNVFKINTDGSGFAILHTFNQQLYDGCGPYAGLVLSGGVLYGATRDTYGAGPGTIFKINVNGSGYSILHRFSLGAADPGTASYTHNDRASPTASLMLSGATLCGTAMYGGPSRHGTDV